MNCISHAETPLGGMLMASDGESLTGLWFVGQKNFAAGLSPDAIERECAVFDETRLWLEIYFSGRQPDFRPPLAPAGSEFRHRVWRRMAEILWGKTVSYGEIARAIGSAAHPVGGAVAHNPILLILPCHRVIGTDGNLTGFDAGVERKLWLLRHEASHL